MLSKSLKLFIFIALAIFLIGCEQSKTSQIKKGVAPVADSEVAVIEMQEPVYGKITIELYSNIAPEMVRRFKELAREGIYDGTTFHRVNPTVVQGGDPLSKDNNPANDGTGGSRKPNVAAEFSDVLYDTGIVGAARAQDVNSANAQFFIMLKREPQFDQKYTIFGKVIDGMNNVRTIAGAPREGERPLEDIKIKTVTIEPKK
jgi:cyclophilin family peptidyl-prolyl cis-trans isomerase